MPRELLLILTLIVIIIIVVLLQRHNDGFEDYTSFVEDRARHFANIGLGLKVSNSDGTLGNTANPLASTVGIPSDYPLPEGPTDLAAVIKKCESVKTADCSVFDNPAFQEDCGVCLDIGENSERIPTKGGLVVLASEKKVAREDQRGSSIPNYSPTVGSCPAGKLVTTKAECKKLERQLLCEKNSTYDLQDCSQCYSTTNYSIVDPNENPGVIASSGRILIYGLGTITFVGDGFSSKNPIPLSESTPYTLNIRGKESSRIKISVYPPVNSDPENPQIPYIYGFISGPTQSGRFDLDLRRIILNDEVTGRRPRSDGNKTIRGTTTTKMAPGFGQERMVLSVIVPFSFVDPTTQEASKCRDAPFVTTKASAEFLESDPCYKKGSGPGKFSLECLQGAWETNGCTERGKGYPGGPEAASNLMANPDGSLRSLNDISDFIYKMALITTTGTNEKGRKMEIEQQSKASVFCTGREITSPCDTAAKDSGPLSPECIRYLWNNKGEAPLPNGSKNPVGQTYSGSAFSLFNKGNGLRFCQETGTLSPFSSNDNIKYWQKFGGVTAVKREMNNLHVAANAQFQADDKLAPYLRQCYGEIEIAKPPPCSTSLLPPSFVPRQNTVLASNLQMTEDFILTMDITPRGTVGNWGSIIHFTTGPDCCDLGQRAPGLWFAPGSIDTFALHIGNSNEGGWAARPSGMPFAVGKTSNLKIECRGQNVAVTVDGKVYNYSHSGNRYTGIIKTVYGSDPWYPAANCSVDNVCLRTFPSATPAWIEKAKAGGWRVMDGGLSNITISNDGIIFGVNSSDNIYRRDSISSPWRQLPGALVQISASHSNKVTGANRGTNIYRGDGNGGWTNIPGGAHWTAASHQGDTWVIGTNDLGGGGYGFWRKDGSNAPNWSAVPGAAVMISVGENNIWCVNRQGNPYKYIGGGSTWQLMPLPDGKPLRNVAVSVNGKRVLAVTKNSEHGNEGAIYAWNQGNWVKISGHLNQVAICDTMIVGVATYGQIWYLPLPAN